MKKQTPTKRIEAAIKIIDARLEVIKGVQGYLALDLYTDCIDLERFNEMMDENIWETEKLLEIKNALLGDK